MNNIALTFEQIVAAIVADGRRVTHMVRGEPGCGKSTIAKRVSALTGQPYVYMDIANMALGDLTLPAANHELGCAKQLPNEVLQLHTGKPLVIMMDEWTKGTKEVKNMTLPMMLERRLGSIRFHPDTIVMASGNLAMDGVGDSIQAHQQNRFAQLTMKKPSAEEWINNFALGAKINPAVIAMVHQYPHMLQSYVNDTGNTNPYIFNPKKQQSAFVSPRSLELASHCVDTKHLKDETTLHAQLAGLIGAAAAGDLISMANITEQLPPWKSIVADPMGVTMPDNATNRLLLLYNVISRVEQDTLTPVLQFVSRLENELQGLFMNRILTIEDKKNWASKHPAMAPMITNLKHLFG